jgi:hypothetical protein
MNDTDMKKESDDATEISDRLFEYFVKHMGKQDIRTCLAAITLFQIKLAFVMDKFFPADKMMGKMVEALEEARKEIKGWDHE